MKIKVVKKRIYWYWLLVASNGQVLATSETYSSRAKAYQTAKLVREKTGLNLVS